MTSDAVSSQVEVMVLNFCLPHFHTDIQSNKLCADGHDVSNLLSGDPVARRRGFKLEYFLRPPLHVTLRFPVRIELCRVDVELWPWGMDQSQASRKLEILTCSDPPGQQEQDCGRFKLVGRCDLREELQVCFLHPTFKHRAPFPDPPPQLPAQAKRLDLWSRGPQSLSSVAELRISIPYSAAASALGIKSLSVWGLPARCCSPSDLRKLQETHLNSLKPNPPSAIAPSLPKPEHVPADNPIPEEFLDPLTQELMVFPMILPSGMVIDNSTLEEYQKREATWGRLPNDPFTGVAFTQNSKPLPNPLLKSRIDRLMLRAGCTGMGNKSSLLAKPQASRLITSSNSRPPITSAHFSSEQNEQGIQDNIETVQAQSKGPQSQKTDNHNGLPECKSKPVICGNELESVSSSTTAANVSKIEKKQTHSAKRKYESSLPSSTADQSSSSVKKVLVTEKIPSRPAERVFSLESHERRLADSLDQALSSALNGLPMFTSQSRTDSSGRTSAEQHKCGSCSCSLTVYSMSSLVYSLPCGHLMCGPCVRHKHPADSQVKMNCPTCGSAAASSEITRVHH